MVKYDVAKYNLIYIYAIDDDTHKGLLKIGQTSFSSSYSITQLSPNCSTLNQNAHLRIQQQTKTALVSYNLLYTELATRTITMQDGSSQIQAFEDHDVHNVLLNSGFHSKKFVESGKPSEWFEVDFDSAKKAIEAVKEGRTSLVPNNYGVSVYKPKITLRREQEENVKYTIDIFKRYDTMLWDCKMRYGKTVTAYELIKRQGYKKVIVITHRPAVEDSWGSDHDLIFGDGNHLFIDKTQNTSYVYDDKIDYQNDCKLKQVIADCTPFVYFASLQDLRGSTRVGGKFNKNNAVFDTDWDLLIIDEAHEGTATDLGDAVINNIRKPNTKVLLLSGTPYNILSDFGENKYTWTYVDEQKAKKEWDEDHPDERNPYEELPKMNIFTFDLSEKIPTSYRYVTEDSAFNFREFFRTWTGDKAKDFREIPEGQTVGDFVYADDVYDFLSLISKDDPDSNYPFSTEEYREMFAHTFWIVPGVKEAKALSAMIQTHPNFKDFEVVNIAGDGDEEKPYDEALALVKSCIKSYPKTITISCGKLTTGVTVREWTGIMMLSGSSTTSAQGYMQAIFRVQSPGYINGKQKKNCYVFDFAPDRTLKVIAEVHRVTHKSSQSDEKAKSALGEFINFCPIISVEGTGMRTYDVAEMMRQIKRISVETAINSGFDDDTIYIADAGMNLTEVDAELLRKLSDVVSPKKKGQKQNEVDINKTGMTDEQRKLAKKAERKPKKDLTEEEKKALELYKQQKEEQKKLFNLLRAVSIRLPLLFYGADADITQIIHLKDFVTIVDTESWEEFMPKGLRQELFLDILKYYDEDVVVGAGLRIRKLAKAADELPPTLRAKRIVEIMSKFKNPDKETVLTPWRVVNMHMGNTLGGYNFFDEQFQKEIDEPRFIDQGDVSADLFLNTDAKILEMNSKSGLYPLYLAYSFYMLNVSGNERDLSLEEAQKIWFDTLDKHIYVLCKTKMARMITIRTLAGYSGKNVHAIYLPKLIESWMKDIPRLSNKLTNPTVWNQGGDRMKFDAVVGNPPYQDSISINNRAGAVYPFFYDVAELLTERYTLISPARFLFNTGLTSKEWNKKMLENCHLKVVYYQQDATKVFPNTDIKGGIAIVYYDAKQDFGKIGEFIPDEKLRHLAEHFKNDPQNNFSKIVFSGRSDLKFTDTFISAYPQSIADRLDAIRESHPNVEGLSQNEEYELKSSTFEVLPYVFHDEQPQDESNYYKLLGLISGKRTCRWIEKKYMTPRYADNNIGKYKVFVPESNGSGTLGEVLSTPLVAKPNFSSTPTFISIGSFATEKEALNALKYIKTKFVRILLGILKKTQHNPASTWAYVPMQNFTDTSPINWNLSISEIDAQLYKKYNLSIEDIDFIEKTALSMD